MAISKVFDGLSDLLMGRIIDRTKSRFGKARPWYLRMIFPTVLSVLLLFWMPAGLMGNWKYVYIFITYNLVSTVCYTANAVAHSSMMGFMTLNTKSRGILGVMSMVSNSVFTLLVTNFFMRLCKLFGGGNAYTQKSFTYTVIVYLVLYTISSLLAFILSRERINNCDVKEEDTNEQGTQATAKQGEEVAPVSVVIKSLLTNKYWLLCNIMCLGFFFLMSFSASATVYFAQYIMGEVELQGTLGTMLYLMVIVGIGCAVPVMNKFGKRTTMAIGFTISTMGWLMPQFSLQRGYVIFAMAVAGLGFGCIAAPAGSFLQDTLTYGTWKTGVSAIGMGNAVFSFTNKLASALGMFLLGVILDAGKFNASLDVQPASAITAIKFLYIWLPAIICFVCLLLSFLYDLDKKLPMIEADVKAGRIGDKRSKI